MHEFPLTSIYRTSYLPAIFDILLIVFDVLLLSISHLGIIFMGRGVVDTGLMSVGNPLPKCSLDLVFCHFQRIFI